MSSYDKKIQKLGCPTPAPRHLLAPGTKPPMRVNAPIPKGFDPAKKAPSFSYRQGGKSGGNESTS